MTDDYTFRPADRYTVYSGRRNGKVTAYNYLTQAAQAPAIMADLVRAAKLVEQSLSGRFVLDYPPPTQKEKRPMPTNDPRVEARRAANRRCALDAAVELATSEQYATQSIPDLKAQEDQIIRTADRLAAWLEETDEQALAKKVQARVDARLKEIEAEKTTPIRSEWHVRGPAELVGRWSDGRMTHTRCKYTVHFLGYGSHTIETVVSHRMGSEVTPNVKMRHRTVRTANGRDYREIQLFSELDGIAVVHAAQSVARLVMP